MASGKLVVGFLHDLAMENMLSRRDLVDNCCGTGTIVAFRTMARASKEALLTR